MKLVQKRENQYVCNVWRSLRGLDQRTKSRGRVAKRSGCTCAAFGGPGACFDSSACRSNVPKPLCVQRLVSGQGRTLCAKTWFRGDQATIRCVETRVCVASGGP